MSEPMNAVDLAAGTVLDVVICTYDNPRQLDEVLGALARQQRADGAWRVLIVDNNSGPSTRQVVDRHQGAGAIPGLRRVVEPTQGLTPARLCGVRATSAPWIAFVDDDCVLDQGWVAHVIAYANAHPGCGGFGGRVLPAYAASAPAVLASYGWAFAEQDLGPEAMEVDCLVGAGMVLNRVALCASGWVDEPFLADRVGRKLISGGDVEIALRVAATGRPLWYVPGCSLRHAIPAHRTTMPYLVRMTRGLGVSFSLAQALTWPGSRRSWARAVPRQLARSLRLVLAAARRALQGTVGRQDATLSSSYEWGRWLGLARVARLLLTRRCRFFGQASVDRVHAVRAG